MSVREIDLSDPELYASGDPHSVWSYLRKHEPVFWQEHGYGPGFWAITKYDDVLRLSTDRRLSSAGDVVRLRSNVSNAIEHLPIRFSSR
jgi:cytochrome P450